MIGKIKMFLTPYNTVSMAQAQKFKTQVKMNKERFQIFMNLKGFSKDDIRVKARHEFVQIEGRSETKTSDALIVREFVKRIRLPKGCYPEEVSSTMTSDGVLVINAKIDGVGPNYRCERLVPIKLIEAEAPTPMSGDEQVMNSYKDPEKKKPNDPKCP